MTKNKGVYKAVTYIGMAITILLFIYWYRIGIFTSEIKLKSFLESAGVIAPILFIFIQAIQVVFPIIPGSLGCPIAVIFWGPVIGFIYNYIGICIGSMAAFIIAKRHGIPLVKNIIGDEKYHKYSKWLDEKINFDRIFTFLMFFPFGPDDFLCYFAGLKDMSVKKFTTILLLSKPLSIIIYSYVLVKVLNVLGIGG